MPSTNPRQDDQKTVKGAERKKAWTKPVFKDLRLGFEITMYFWNR